MADPGFPIGRGANLRGRGTNLLFGQTFSENCVKMKKFGPNGGGARPLRPLLDPPMNQSDIFILLEQKSLTYYSELFNVKVSEIQQFFFFFKFFVWTKVHFVEPLIAPVLDFVCPSLWVSNPEWISCLHSFLLACCHPEGHVWCHTCLFHQ